MTFKPKLVCLTQRKNNYIHEFCSELKVNPNCVGRGLIQPPQTQEAQHY